MNGISWFRNLVWFIALTLARVVVRAFMSHKLADSARCISFMTHGSRTITRARVRAINRQLIIPNQLIPFIGLLSKMCNTIRFLQARPTIAMSRCFAALRQLRQIRHSVPAATFQTLVVDFHSRLTCSRNSPRLETFHAWNKHAL